MRVEVTDLDKLALLQTITGTPTAEVVHDVLMRYIKSHEDKLKEAGERLASGSYWDAE